MVQYYALALLILVTLAVLFSLWAGGDSDSIVLQDDPKS